MASIDLLTQMSEGLDRARRADDVDAAREAFVARFAFSVPTPEAIDLLARHSPHGIVEIGAGTGVWARLLVDAGLDVAAFDLEPAPSPANRWFAGSPSWYPVVRADHTVVADHGSRTLLVVWPPQGEIWPAEALDLFHRAGGERVAYVGQGPGGRTAEEVFHARLGDLHDCLQCTHGVLDVPCICDIEPQWRRVATAELPSWDGDDALGLYERLP